MSKPDIKLNKTPDHMRIKDYANHTLRQHKKKLFLMVNCKEKREAEDLLNEVNKEYIEIGRLSFEHDRKSKELSRLISILQPRSPKNDR